MSKPAQIVFNRFEASSISRHLPDPGETSAVQAARDETDINTIVERLSRGQDPGVQQHHGSYSDNTGHVDMKSNLDIIRSHYSRYNELPDQIREIYKTPLEYYNAEQQALEKSLETRDPLDVSGLTDSKAGSSTKNEGEQREEKTSHKQVGQKNVQKSDRGTSGE